MLLMEEGFDNLHLQHLNPKMFLAWTIFALNLTQLEPLFFADI